MKTCTQEEFVAAVAALAIARLSDQDLAAQLRKVRFTFGHGLSGAFGFCRHQGWKEGDQTTAWIDLSAVTHAAYGWEEIADTTLHELGHAAAGAGHGHDQAWRDACEKLGLRKAKAAGVSRGLSRFAPDIRQALVLAPKPIGRVIGGVHNGGALANPNASPSPALPARPARPPCSHGLGTRGGVTHNANRWRLWLCACVPPVKIRAGRRDLDCRCGACRAPFKPV